MTSVLKLIALLIFIAIVTAFFCTCYDLVMLRLQIHSEETPATTTYEAAGTIAAGLFSALAFFVMIYSLHLQRRELELQREELKRTNEALLAQHAEMAAQKEAAQHQNTILSSQQFDSSFYLHFEIYRTTLNSIIQESEIQNVDRRFNRHSFGAARMKTILQGRLFDLQRSPTEIFNNCLATVEDFIQPLTLLHGLVLLIDKTMLISTDQKKDYMERLYSVLTTYEMIYLALYAIQKGDNNLRKLLSLFEFSSHLPLPEVIDPSRFCINAVSHLINGINDGLTITSSS